MPVTVHIRSGAGDEASAPKLTFDGTRVAIGRSSGCDVRLPDPSVSHRHATLRAQGAEYVLVDEGSSNGTFVGGVRLLPQTPRAVRSGDLVRLGRVWLEIEVGHAPATADLGLATRDLALQLVARAMEAEGADVTPRVRVAEGPDLGAELVLDAVDKTWVIGRAAHCDLPLADADASREHLHVVRRGASTFLVDLGSKNGVSLGEARVASHREVLWRAGSMLRVGRTVLALDEPAARALVELEEAADEPVALEPETPPPPSRLAPAAAPEAQANEGAVAQAPSPLTPDSSVPPPEAPRPSAFRPADVAVIVASLVVLGLSVAGFYWLLR